MFRAGDEVMYKVGSIEKVCDTGQIIPVQKVSAFEIENYLLGLPSIIHAIKECAEEAIPDGAYFLEALRQSGKTTALVEAIKQFVRRRTEVNVVASNHSALESLASQIEHVSDKDSLAISFKSDYGKRLVGHPWVGIDLFTYQEYKEMHYHTLKEGRVLILDEANPVRLLADFGGLSNLLRHYKKVILVHTGTALCTMQRYLKEVGEIPTCEGSHTLCRVMNCMVFLKS